MLDLCKLQGFSSFFPFLFPGFVVFSLLPTTIEVVYFSMSLCSNLNWLAKSKLIVLFTYIVREDFKLFFESTNTGIEKSYFFGTPQF